MRHQRRCGLHAPNHPTPSLRVSRFLGKSRLTVTLIHKYLTAFVSALASQPPFIPRPPIYAGVESTSISQGQRMPTSRPGKFTVIQTSGLARHLTFFPTENEPIFRHRFQGLKPDRRAHFAGIQTKANSRYAIQKTGVNSGSDHADHPGASAAIPFLRSPDPRKRTHFSPRGRHARVPGAARKNRAQSQFAMLAPGQPAYGCSREGLWGRQFRATRPSRLILAPMTYPSECFSTTILICIASESTTACQRCGGEDRVSVWEVACL